MSGVSRLARHAGVCAQFLVIGTALAALGRAAPAPQQSPDVLGVGFDGLQPPTQQYVQRVLDRLPPAPSSSSVRVGPARRASRA